MIKTVIYLMNCKLVYIYSTYHISFSVNDLVVVSLHVQKR